MKPYGRYKKYKGTSSKKDVHPKKGYVNWWENVCEFLTRSSIKKQWKKDNENQ